MATFLQPSQSNASPAGGGGSGNLAGSTYSGAFTNLANDLPGIGGLLTSLYGTKYSIPDPTQTAGSAIAGNTGNLGADQQLTLGADTIGAEGAALPFQMNLPNYEGMLGQASSNTSQELSGQVPKDVQNLLAQQASERGISTGQGAGSPNNSAAYLQALGLTSLGQEQQGQSNLSQLIGETPTGPQFNPSSMFVTPEQAQAAQLAANQESAAPDPALAGLASTFMSFI